MKIKSSGYQCVLSRIKICTDTYFPEKQPANLSEDDNAIIFGSVAETHNSSCIPFGLLYH